MNEPTPSVGLASRVLAAIEEAEQRFTVPLEVLRADLIGQAAVRIAAHMTPERARETAERIADVVMPSTATDIVADRGAVLRRCVADRRVWRRHEPNVIDGRETPVRISCAYCSSGRVDAVPWPCPDVMDLAEGYGIATEEDQ